jgi:hypothetical protein
MSRALGSLLAGTVCLAVAAGCCCGAALGYLTGAGSGSADAAVSALEAPSVEAAPSGAAVALSWSAVSAPGAGTVTYSVSRDGGEAGGDCAAAESPTQATSCTDAAVPAGLHAYTVSAHWRSWSATSAPVEAITGPGPAARFAIAATSTAPVVGTADGLTITALDADGEVATAYSGGRSLVFSGAQPGPDGTVPTVTDASGNAVAFGAPTALSFKAGVASVTGSGNGVLRLYLAGTTAIAASAGSLSTPEPLSLGASAGEPRRLAFHEIEASDGTIGVPCLFACAIAGLGNGGTVSGAIAVTDAFGNVVEDIGKNHRARVTATTGSVNTPSQSFPASGPAIATKPFTYTAPKKGAYTATLTAATNRGTVYEEAVATISR